jgi:hypothetical protein
MKPVKIDSPGRERVAPDLDVDRELEQHADDRPPTSSRRRRSR